MSRPYGGRFLLCFTLASCLAAGAAFADGSEPSPRGLSAPAEDLGSHSVRANRFGPAAGARLTPGALMALPLDTDRLPAGADEMELLLSLDGGVSYSLRVTRMRSRDERTELLWRVPSVPASHARLALRAGRDGEEEVLVAESLEFAIEADAAAPLEALVSYRGELHTRDAVEPGSGGELPLGRLGSAGEELLPLSPAAEPGRPPLPFSLEPDPPSASPVPPGRRPTAAVTSPLSLRPALSLPKRE